MTFPKVVGSFSNLPQSPPKGDECDVVEVRLDAPLEAQKLERFLKGTTQEKLFTYRDYAEGGSYSSGPIPVAKRMESLRAVLGEANYIDVELRNWKVMQEMIQEARQNGCLVIGSRHDFSGTPYDEIPELISLAREQQVDVLKMAFTPQGVEDLVLYERLLRENADLSISLMGMGKYGAVSRLLMAQSGSVLNYGYLGESPTASGQWSARLLKEAIHQSQQVV